MNNRQNGLTQNITARWNAEQWSGLVSSFTKAELMGGWFRFVKQFLFENSGSSWENLTAQRLLLVINSKKDFSREELCALSFAVLENKEIFDDFFQYLPDTAQKAIILLVWEGRCNRTRLEKAMGDSILNEKEQIRLELKLLKMDEIYYSRYRYSDHKKRWNPDFILPTPLRDIIREYIDKPEGYYIKPLQELSFAKDVSLFSAEKAIFEELPRLLAYHQQGKIKYNLHGSPNITNIKKIVKSLQIKEFYPEYSSVPTRTNMLAGLLYEYAENKTGLEDVIKVLFQEHFCWNTPKSQYTQTRTPLYLYNFLNGLGRIEATSLNGEFNLYLKNQLQKLSPGEWVTAKNYAQHLAFNSILIKPFLFGEERRLYSKNVHDYGYIEKEHVDSDNIQTFVIAPYVNGLIFVLAALGIVEIAYHKVPIFTPFGTNWYSEYDGLEAFRLTPLGAYALGITDSYEAPVTLATNKFLFEEDALMLRVEGDFDIIDVMLEQFLEKTSNNRYAFNTGLFLGDCKTPKDIEHKITLFKQTINTTLPQFWQNHLNQLLENTKSIQQKQGIVIYQIDAANKDLQRHLAQDAVLKSITLKAEQFHVIIAATNMARFQSRMKELGYLVEQKK